LAIPDPRLDVPLSAAHSLRARFARGTAGLVLAPVVEGGPVIGRPVDDGVARGAAAEATTAALAGAPAEGALAESLSPMAEGLDTFSSPVEAPAGIPVHATASPPFRWIWPVRGRLSQTYSEAHPAIDVMSDHGAIVVAADAGEVVYAEWEVTGFGYLVVIDHGDGYRTYYGHLYGFYVEVGQQVSRGDPLGQLGSTGNSTGPHLHFEIRQQDVRLDPLELLPPGPR
jgi:murein DD-endopeptidase MepM/ murein hydrolase activator NlpD